MQQVEEVLLIDDDPASLFLHDRLMRKCDRISVVHKVASAKEALDWLAERKVRKVPLPQIILIDVNMPGMNAWEFFRACLIADRIDPSFTSVFLITNLLLPDIQAKAEEFKTKCGIVDVVEKMLTTEKLHTMIDQHHERLA